MLESLMFFWLWYRHIAQLDEESCGHEAHEDCMFCLGCGSGCREDLNENDLCPDCEEDG